MTIQIALKLPDAVVEEIDQLVDAGQYQSRSQVVRQGIDSILALHRREAIDASFRAGFEAHPDGDAELAEARALGLAAIAEEPWERWW